MTAIFFFSQSTSVGGFGSEVESQAAGEGAWRPDLFGRYQGPSASVAEWSYGDKEQPVLLHRETYRVSL
jgi:hypothetical protein